MIHTRVTTDTAKIIFNNTGLGSRALSEETGLKQETVRRILAEIRKGLTYEQWEEKHLRLNRKRYLENATYEEIMAMDIDKAAKYRLTFKLGLKKSATKLEDFKRLIQAEPNIPSTQIEKRLNLARRTVFRWLNLPEIRAIRKNRFSDVQGFVKDNYKKLSVKDMAEQAGVHYSTIYSHLFKMGLMAEQKEVKKARKHKIQKLNNGKVVKEKPATLREAKPDVFVNPRNVKVKTSFEGKKQVSLGYNRISIYVPSDATQEEIQVIRMDRLRKLGVAV